LEQSKFPFQPEQPVEESIHKVVSVVYDKEPVKCVVIDMDFNVNYCKLTRAGIYLQTNPEMLFIAGATDPALIVHSIALMGPGDTLHCLEQLVKRKATVLGKPGLPLVELLKSEQQFEDPKRVLFIGDT
jgi:farnesyl diphosphate phosphatase